MTTKKSLMKKAREDDVTRDFWNGLHDETRKPENIEQVENNNCSDFLSIDKRILFTAICISLFIV